MSTEQEYCIYIKDGKVISEIMECSSKDNIAVSGIMIIRSSNISGIKEILKLLIVPKKTLTKEIIKDIRDMIKNNDLLKAKQTILEYTGKDLCCVSKMTALLDSFA